MTGNLAITPLTRLSGKLSFFTGFFFVEKIILIFFFQLKEVQLKRKNVYFRCTIRSLKTLILLQVGALVYSWNQAGNLYDYGARFYDPQIARFHIIDPESESFYLFSTYIYAANNPIRYIDAQGLHGDSPMPGDFEYPGSYREAYDIVRKWGAPGYLKPYL